MFRQKKKGNDDIFQRLHHRSILCFSAKDPKTYRETILGKNGTINIAEGEMVIVCQNQEVFRKRTNHLQVAELLSHEGFTLRDLEDESGMTYMVYYTK